MGTAFGSTQKEDPNIDDGMVIAGKVRKNTATVEGMSVELQIQKQQIKDLYDKLTHMNNYCQSLQMQFDAFKRQRVVELQEKVGHGPTS